MVRIERRKGYVEAGEQKKGHLQGSLDCVMGIVLAQINYSGHTTENIVFLCVSKQAFPLEMVQVD